MSGDDYRAGPPGEGGGDPTPEAASHTTEDTAHRKADAAPDLSDTGDKCGGDAFLRALSLGGYALDRVDEEAA